MSDLSYRKQPLLL